MSPPVATFNVSASGCTLEGWGIEADSFFYVYDSAPQEAFDPYDNSEAGPQDVIVTAYNHDYDKRLRSFAGGFSLKRQSAWQPGSFNASPEPVRKGSAITIRGQLMLADWTNDRYVGYTNRTVSVEFRTATGSYAQIKTAMTGSGGYLSTTVTASRDGYWRLRYGGNSYAGGAVVAGDYVDVQ